MKNITLHVQSQVNTITRHDGGVFNPDWLAALRGLNGGNAAILAVLKTNDPAGAIAGD